MNKKKRKISVIAGGAGFIGINLINELNKLGNQIIILDNFSLGSKNNLDNFLESSDYALYEIDISKSSDVKSFFDECIKNYGKIDEIWHLAANSDIPAGIENPDIDHVNTFLTTYRLLRESSKYDIETFNFASSSAVYGDWGDKSLSEKLGPLKPISNYGAMKLASEAQISASAENSFKKVNIFRFPNVVGAPATHGVIFDFINKIKSDNPNLEVLGNGKQKKSYLHVSELISAMIHVSESDYRNSKVEIINIGCSDRGITVEEIAKIVKEITHSQKQIVFERTDRGWMGDVPRFSYDISYLHSFGWKSSISSREAILLAAKEINLQLNKRSNL